MTPARMVIKEGMLGHFTKTQYRVYRDDPYSVGVEIKDTEGWRDAGVNFSDVAEACEWLLDYDLRRKGNAS